MIMAAFQDAAREYAAAGIVPLPMAPDGKRPLVNHPERFGQRAALSIVPKFPDANLGFMCGERNHLTVVDVDDPRDSEMQWALDTFGQSPVIVRTAGGRYHGYYRHDGERRRIRPIEGHAVDLLGAGPCVAPPSVRVGGGRYEFVRGGLADLANLPKIRRGVLQSLEPKLVDQIRPDSAIARAAGDVATIGRRNDSLFRLVLALAHDAETVVDLLADARKANDSLSSPPLPDAEVQGRVRSAWRYKQEGRLMAPGRESSIILPTATVDRLLASGDLDVMALMAMARKYHDRPGAVFILAPQAMADAHKIGSWGRNRYRAAIRKACELGVLMQVTAGGRGPRDPGKYRFAALKAKGSGLNPNTNQTPSPLSPRKKSEGPRDNIPRGMVA